MKKYSVMIALGILLLFLAGCRGAEFIPASAEMQSQEVESPAAAVSQPTAEPMEVREENTLQLFINDTCVPVIWEENNTVEALKREAPIAVNMTMYGGNEQFGPLGKAYPRADHQMTTQNGDIVLYSGDQIVVFYGPNSWAYTKLGKMDLPEDAVTELLSQADVTLTIR